MGEAKQGGEAGPSKDSTPGGEAPRPDAPPADADDAKTRDRAREKASNDQNEDG